MWCQTSCKRFKKALKKLKGFTLVELMVSLSISLVVVIAASYAYLGTRESQRTLREKAYAFESAKFALDVIGRDIENAGFYPAIRSETGAETPHAMTVENYINPLPASPPTAFNAPIFGCQAERFLPASQVCAAHSTTVDADALVINYYTNDAAGLDIGNRADCLRQDAANEEATNNQTEHVRRHSAHATTAMAERPFLIPQHPLFVSNRYTLIANTLQIEGQSINTFSLACHGNGQTTPDNTYVSLIPGVDQLRFYFLVKTGTSSRFRRADAVGADWPDVIAVRVCLLARSLQSARLQGRTSYTLTDCDDTTHAYTDGVERRVFSQLFALNNQLHDTF